MIGRVKYRVLYQDLIKIGEEEEEEEEEEENNDVVFKGVF